MLVGSVFSPSVTVHFTRCHVSWYTAVQAFAPICLWQNEQSVGRTSKRGVGTRKAKVFPPLPFRRPSFPFSYIPLPLPWTPLWLAPALCPSFPYPRWRFSFLDQFSLARQIHLAQKAACRPLYIASWAGDYGVQGLFWFLHYMEIVINFMISSKITVMV